MTSSSKLTFAACAALLLIGCGDDAVTTEDLGRLDANVADGGSLDSGTDAPSRPDLGTDLGMDAARVDMGAPDLGADAGPPDLGADAGPPDLGFDAGPPDHGFDAGPDLGPDTCRPEICDNATDDDCDGLIDCADSDCNTVACDDGNDCTHSETCSGGACVGAPVSCVSDACATRACNGTDTCTVAPITGSCDDGNACSYGDACNNAVCVGTPITCSSDSCMERACNGTNACTETPIRATESCDSDGSACTPDVCSSVGVCTHVVCDGAVNQMCNANRCRYTSYVFEAEDPAAASWHGGGRLTSSGDGWEARPSDTHGVIVYGPYVTMVPGEYRADFRLKVSDSAAEGDFFIDVAQNGGGTYVVRQISPPSFTASDTYQTFSLDFTAVLDTTVETRVTWGAEYTLTVDKVTISPR